MRLVRHLGAALLLLGSAAVAAAQPAALPREAVEQIIRDYLREHPEVVVEAFRAYEAKQRADEEARVGRMLDARRQELVADPDAPVGGNPAGDVTVVEFFDYRCGYCRGVAPAVRALVQADPRVRLVYKELPILGPDSLVAARMALAARAQGKYTAFHDALMAVDGPLTSAAALGVARTVGLDTDRLERDMATPAITAALQRNLDLARALGLNGTPAFVVGGQIAPGALDLEALKRLVEEARAKR